MIFVIKEIVCIPTGTSSALKKTGKESQYIVWRSRLSSVPLFGWDRESGCYTSDLDIHFFALLAAVAVAGTLVDDTLARNSSPIYGLVMLLHHMRSSHGSLVRDCSVWASWDSVLNDSFFIHSGNWPPQLHKDLHQLIPQHFS